MTHLCVVVTARPSYSRIRSVLLALAQRPDVRLTVIAAASALLERYGRVVEFMRADGLDPLEVLSVVEGETGQAAAAGTGLLTLELAQVFAQLRPDRVVTIADRHETLATAIAAAYQQIPLVHVQGGETTGSIDDKVRWAVTMLADVHLAATAQAGCRLAAARPGGRVMVTGCPSIDLAREALTLPPVGRLETGAGLTPVDLRGAVVVLQHAVTDEADDALAQMALTLETLRPVKAPLIVFWPGQDAGAGGVSKAIRLFRETYPQRTVHTQRNLPPLTFLRMLLEVSCLVGNSSVGLRECSYLGVPVVNIGTRQRGRERAENVTDVDHDGAAIRQAVDKQRDRGPYPSSPLYGDGHATDRMVEVLCQS